MFNHIYGPVSSWRLGNSLGVDCLSQDPKICTFDCIYCQVGKTPAYTIERKVYVPTEEVIKELKALPEAQIDYITFSGRGEPTLAENLGEMIKAIKKIRKEPVAVLTNSSLLDREDVRKDLCLADFVMAKLDAWSPEGFKEINRPAPGIEFSNVLGGIKQFRKEYQGKLALQIMFVEENKDKAKELVDLVNSIKPDEVQINTPLRPCDVKPLSKTEIFNIKEYFSLKCGDKINIVSVYDAKRHKKIIPVSSEDTLKRR